MRFLLTFDLLPLPSSLSRDRQVLWRNDSSTSARRVHGKRPDTRSDEIRCSAHVLADERAEQTNGRSHSGANNEDADGESDGGVVGAPDNEGADGGAYNLLRRLYVPGVLRIPLWRNGCEPGNLPNDGMLAALLLQAW